MPSGILLIYKNQYWPTFSTSNIWKQVFDPISNDLFWAFWGTFQLLTPLFRYSFMLIRPVTHCLIKYTLCMVISIIYAKQCLTFAYDNVLLRSVLNRFISENFEFLTHFLRKLWPKKHFALKFKLPAIYGNLIPILKEYTFLWFFTRLCIIPKNCNIFAPN